LNSPATQAIKETLDGIFPAVPIASISSAGLTSKRTTACARSSAEVGIGQDAREFTSVGRRSVEPAAAVRGRNLYLTDRALKVPSSEGAAGARR
jgi:hypothetical protein